MTDEQIAAAEEEALRFLDKVSKYREEKQRLRHGYDNREYTYIPLIPKQSGALRRASMDLTRALADLRRPTPY